MMDNKWHKQKNGEENISAVVRNLFLHLEIKVTDEAVQNAFVCNPESPSLGALRDELLEWNLNCKPVRSDISKLASRSYPAIAHLHSGDGKFVLLMASTEKQVSYIDPAEGWIHEAHEAFEKKWSGILMLVEKQDDSGDPLYKEQIQKSEFQKLKQPLTYIFASVLLAAAIANYFLDSGNEMLAYGALYMSKILGVAVSLLLVTTLAEKSNPIVAKICGTDPNKGCNSVLNSPAANPFPWLSLVEIGAWYFIGSLFAIWLAFFSTHTAAVFYCLSLFNLAALPFTLYSVFYQGVILKDWCKLCLAVQAILWIEFMVYYSNLQFEIPQDILMGIIIVSVAFLLPAIIWIQIKSKWLLRTDIFQNQVKQLLNNYNVFQLFMQQQAEAELSTVPGELYDGNKEAQLKIVLYTRPGCDHCAQAHTDFRTFIGKNKDRVHGIFRFFVTTGRKSLSRNVSRQIISIGKSNGHEKALIALDAWYKISPQTDAAFEKWQKAFPIEADPEADLHLDQHLKWSKDNNLPGTPAFWINQRLLHGYYKFPGAKRHLRRWMRQF